VLGAASEGVEDIHYFQLGMDTPHEHKHDTQALLEERLGAHSGHDHGNDLPTQFLLMMFSPFYVLAACWDFLFNQDLEKFSSWNAFTASFLKSWNKETETEDEETVEFDGGDSCCEEKVCVSGVIEAPAQFATPNAWQTEQALFRIEKEKKGLPREGSEQYIVLLTTLQQRLQVRQSDSGQQTPLFESVINDEFEAQSIFDNRNGFFKENLIERTFDRSMLCIPCTASKGVAAA